MKKILLSLLIVLSLFVLTGCKDNKEKITIKDKKLNYTTTFSYDKEDGFEFVKNIKGGKFSEIEFKNEKENLTFDMYYSESSDDNASTMKKNREKNQKYYKEYKFGEYDGYIYSDYKDNLYVVITLKEDMKENSVTELFVSVEMINYDKDKVVYNMFKKDKIINFFKSIENTVE